ncbi:hypothetical protein I4U23_011938 [Adineta vaga]|nr:hypothetical protein I4U23_011938 [Adineta vaga]
MSVGNLTTNQVGDWLTTNGFAEHIKTFISEDIDGEALFGLLDDEIMKLLTLYDKDGTIRTPTKRKQRKFKIILEEYRTSVQQERRKRRRSRSVINKESNENLAINLRTMPSKVTGQSAKERLAYSKNYVYYISAYVSSDTKDTLKIELTGDKANVTSALTDLQLLSEIMNWSTSIYSDSVLLILQKIFADRKKLTIWEKTNLLSGYFIVYYISGEHRFNLSEEFIYQMLNNEISYVENIVISNMDKCQSNFRRAIKEFINNKKQQQEKLQTMTIIYYQSVSQSEMKISFFGLKYQVDIAKKQLKLLINKHQIRTIRIELDSKQREYLLDNCISQLKQIELDYKDDNVHIQIHSNLLTAPQYLIVKIKQLIQSLLFHTTTLTFRYIENGITLTEHDQLQLKTIGQNHNCQLDHIDTQTEKEIILLPKSKDTPTSKYIMKKSEEFYTSLTPVWKLSVETNTIELRPASNPTSDITVISTTEDIIKENIDSIHRNGHFISENGKNILVILWSPLKDPIEKLISTSFNQIDVLCMDSIESIAFSTTNWEKIDDKRKLAEEMIKEMKDLLETEDFANRSWKISFSFNDEQNDLLKEFSEIIISLRLAKNGYEQFTYPITTTSLTLKTSSNSNIIKSENAINDYMKRSVLSTIEIYNPFDSKIWNQHMINVFYKYCLEKCVLPDIHLFNEQYHLYLIGSKSAVNHAKEKYKFMTEIERLKALIHIPSSESVSKNKNSKTISSTYNIILNGCSNDKDILEKLAKRFNDEGYRVLIDYCDINPSNSKPKQHYNSDLIVICFSYHYSQDSSCMKAMLSIKKSEKKFIPFVLLEKALNERSNWIQMCSTETLFYESFEEEIRFKLEENFDLDYDKLFIELLHYTKPGVVDRIYAISDDVTSTEQREEDFSLKRTLSPFTQEQICKKEEIYREKIEHILERDAIPTDEVTNLIALLGIILGDNGIEGYPVLVEDHQPQDDGYINRVQDYLNSFLLRLQRWIEKASNGPVCKGNIPPFTVTGDFNDAIFPISLLDKTPWWETDLDLYDFDHSSTDFDKVSPELTIGSWSSYDEAQNYFQKLVNKDARFRDKQLNNKKSQVPSRKQHAYFKTNIKRGTIAWDITENRRVLKEYERRKNGGKRKKLNSKTRSSLNLLDRWVQLVSDLKEGRINMKSNEIRGTIGKELKTKDEIRKRIESDDPNNTQWSMERVPPRRRKFIKLKIKNTIEWENFCEQSELKAQSVTIQDTT